MTISSGRFKTFGFAGLLALAAVSLFDLNAFSRVDHMIYDVAVRHLSDPQESEVVIVAIDERSLQSLGRWPWSRRIHADLINTLAGAGVRVIGLDLIFAEPERLDPAGDALLAEAMRRSGRVVLPVVPEPSGGIAGGVRVVLPMTPLAVAAAALGHVEVELDEDGVARHTSLEAGAGGAFWSSFPLAMLRASRIASPYGNSRPRDDGTRTALPPDLWVRDSPILIPFGDSVSRFRRLSYIDVLQGKWNGVNLRGKFVLVGMTAAGLAPRFATPASSGGELMSGSELHAQVLHGLLHDDVLAPLDRSWGMLLTALLVIVPVLVYRIAGRPMARWIALMGLLLSVGTSLGLLAGLRLWFSPVAALVTLGGGYLAWNRWRMEQAARSLRLERERSLATLDSITDAIIITDMEGSVEYLNPVAERLTGRGGATVRGLILDEILRGLSGEDFKARSPSQWIKTAVRPSAPGFFTNPDGREFVLRLSACPIREADREPSRIMVVLSDITETLEISKNATFLATHDALTELPNRKLLEDRLASAIAHGRRTQSSFAVCFIDLDGFKKINDNIGHAAGDALLQEMARRLKSCVRQVDTVARWGGDEFVLLLDRLPGENVAVEVIDKIIAAVSRPFEYRDDTLKLTPSIGVSLFPRDGDTADVLVTKADAAMYLVKQEGRNNFAFYSKSSSAHIELVNPFYAPAPHEYATKLSRDDLDRLDEIRRKSAEEKQKLARQNASGSWLRRLFRGAPLP